MTKFQYISCYGLSCSIYFLKRQFNISIHLMLRFISLRALCQPEDGNFNTSHVTVYHTNSREIDSQSTISIHLMLRFITLI